jgi:hypothetical protein
MRSRVIRLGFCAIIVEFTIALSSLAQATAAPTAYITVKLVLVRQSDLCKGSYKPGHVDCELSTERVEYLEQTNRVSRPYKLPLGKPVALRLDPEFQQALIASIDAGTYAVLLEFDWGAQLTVEVDLARDLCGSPKSHPPWDRNSRHWYTHENAIHFDPDKNVKWQMTLTVVSKWLFCFYVVPAA